MTQRYRNPNRAPANLARAAEFRRDLEALLSRYSTEREDAVIETYYDDQTIYCHLPEVLDENGNMLFPETEFDLGGYLTKD